MAARGIDVEGETGQLPADGGLLAEQGEGFTAE